MLKINEFTNGVANLISGFSQIPEVEGILLAGSRTTNTYDLESDYDIYVK
jgi:predicted nucleotidyltransferase